MPPAKRSTSGFAIHRKDRHLARAFDFVLPPANQPLMMLRAQVLHPQRILHHRVARHARGVTMRAEKFVDGLERDLQLAQPKRRMGPRIQPYVRQLFVRQRDL